MAEAEQAASWAPSSPKEKAVYYLLEDIKHYNKVIEQLEERLAKLEN